MDFNDLSKMMEQARDLQGEMEKKLSSTIVEATTGGGVVTVRMNGKKEVLRLKIEPTAVGSTGADLELLEDLITAAVNEAGRRADVAMQTNVQSLMGGMDLPGMPGMASLGDPSEDTD